MDEKLILKPINDLLGLKFFIPSYQRGYRWTRENVIDLLEDIYDFVKKGEKGAFYCLQPIVVTATDEDEKWEVIDGQQRLTTILIILNACEDLLKILNKRKYSIEYQTRPGSKDYLENMDERLSHKYVDYYYMFQAYQVIQEWFGNIEGEDKIDIIKTLLTADKYKENGDLDIENASKNIKVIWYNVSDENQDGQLSIDIFTRLNIGKIPLTDSELIKALFLQRDNSGNVSDIQNEVARGWEVIESKLENNAFWHFIYNEENEIKYETRIEYLLDLISVKTVHSQEHHTFNHFYRLLKEGKSRQFLWKKIKELLLRLEEWYEENDYFHLVGFLIYSGISINKILKNFGKTMLKNEFISYLEEEIRRSFKKKSLDDFDYGTDKKTLRRIYLLFNLEVLRLNKEMKFPFDLFKEQKWDIEHIHSQTEYQFDGDTAKKWITYLQRYLTRDYQFETFEKETRLKRIKEMKDEHKSSYELLSWFEKLLEKNDFDLKQFNAGLKKRLETEDFSEFKSPEDLDSLGNLTLLDAATNRSYKNMPFPFKKMELMKRDKSGYFIPLCTKNAFLKAYSTDAMQYYYWTSQDVSHHLKEIHNILEKKYFQEENSV